MPSMDVSSNPRRFRDEDGCISIRYLTFQEGARSNRLTSVLHPALAILAKQA